jgi:hypothetical protein
MDRYDYIYKKGKDVYEDSINGKSAVRKDKKEDGSNQPNLV